MTKSLFSLVALALGGVAGCQATPPTTQVALASAPVASPAAGTEAAARAAVARHLRALPNAALFVPDSARVHDNGATWQVLVPRTDRVNYKPSHARFEVDKQTGQVSGRPVK